MNKVKIDETEAEKMYQECLNETNEMFMDTYEPADVLEEYDPIAYRVGLSDYIDSINNVYEVEGY